MLYIISQFFEIAEIYENFRQCFNNLKGLVFCSVINIVVCAIIKLSIRAYIPVIYVAGIFLNRNKTGHKLIRTNPTIQTIIPIIWRMEIFSLYKKYPIISSTQARPILATTGALLTFQPARYTNTYPTSKPTRANAKMTDVQLTLDNSNATCSGFAMKTNMTAVIITAIIYVTINAAKGLTSDGVDFIQIL